MATTEGRDPLIIDIASDLERVDDVFTAILKDRSQWDDFKRDPNGTFIRLGLHPPTSGPINERVNRIFYAVMTNRELLKLLLDAYEDFKPERLDAYQQEYLRGLRQGIVRNDVDFDIDAIEHLFTKPEVMRRMYQLMLHDLNDQGILEERHPREEIEKFVDDLLAAVQKRLPIRDHPKLEIWDRNYGIGNHYGTGAAEVGPVATVEVGGVVTAIVAVPAYVFGLAEQNVLRDEIIKPALLGDLEAARAFAVIGRMMDLGADMFMHAYAFERR